MIWIAAVFAAASAAKPDKPKPVAADGKPYGVRS